MDQIKQFFEDGIVVEIAGDATGLDLLKQVNPANKNDVLALLVNGEIRDLRRPLVPDAKVRFLTFDQPEGKEVYWHSSAHLMAHAVEQLFPGAKFGVGPAIEEGFFYDIDAGGRLTLEDLPRIEAKMKELAKENSPFVRLEVSKEEALDLFSKKGDEYKLELISGLIDKDAQISLYREGEFTDLCRGPHLPTAGKIKQIKLFGMSGSYWRGDSKGKPMQRIYGITFPAKEQLDAYVLRMEEARKRDHRKLGAELDIFSMHEEGPGFPFWHNNGVVIIRTLEEYLRKKLARRGYEEIITPIILDQKMWLQSGHYENFKDKMYFTNVDEREFAVKPMNCPGSTLVYRTKQRSYRDLPLKLAEFGLVHRNELAGVLHGLLRVRSFTQDDAHVFCAPEQIEDAIVDLIDLTNEVYSTFGFKELETFIATRPELSMGSDEIWENSTNALANALKRRGMEFSLNEGEGAFYGPKIEFNIRDAIGRKWQCGTIQVDFSMPERFGLEYVGADNARHTPVMVHRAIFGSIERFVAILIENYAGRFPVWLAPVQTVVLPIGEGQRDYAVALHQRLVESGIRAQVDLRNEKIGYKIRDWELKKVPYIFVVGAKEAESGAVAVRKHGDANNEVIAADEAVRILLTEAKIPS